jgi:hypothetical protein
MCGAPKSQTITQKTELDPNLQRLLYGGIFPGAPAAQPAAGPMSDNGGNGGSTTATAMSSYCGSVEVPAAFASAICLTAAVRVVPEIALKAAVGLGDIANAG